MENLEDFKECNIFIENLQICITFLLNNVRLQERFISSSDRIKMQFKVSSTYKLHKTWQHVSFLLITSA